MKEGWQDARTCSPEVKSPECENCKGERGCGAGSGKTCKTCIGPCNIRQRCGIDSQRRRAERERDRQKRAAHEKAEAEALQARLRQSKCEAVRKLLRMGG